MTKRENSRILLQNEGLDPQNSPLLRLWRAANGPVVLAVIWAGAILHLASVFAKLPQRVTQTDFSVYYASALVLRDGGNPYTTDISPVARRLGLDVGPLVHDDSMPFFLLCFEPLTHLSPRAAYWIWFATNCGCLALAMILLLQGVGRAWLLLAPLMLLYQPLAEHFAYARTEVPILVMLVLMLRWLEQGREASAGLMLALAGALRGFPLVLGGYLLLRGRWRSLLYASAGLAVLGVATLALVGLPRCLSFVEGALFSSEYQFAAMFLDLGLSSFVSRLFWYPFGPDLGHTLELLRSLAVVGAELALLALTVRATLASSDGLRAFSLWVVTSILLSPIAWVHYMVLIFILFAQLAVAANQQRCSERALWAMVASYILLKVPNDLIEIGRRHHIPALFFGVGELYFVTLALAYLSAYWLALDSSSTPSFDLATESGVDLARL
jgi:hypothetical protein